MKNVARMMVCLACAATLFSTDAAAQDEDKAVLGGLVGGIAGAMIGQHFYGEDGAAAGATFGTAAGAAVATKRQREFVNEQLIVPATQPYAPNSPWNLLMTAPQPQKRVAARSRRTR